MLERLSLIWLYNQMGLFGLLQIKNHKLTPRTILNISVTMHGRNKNTFVQLHFVQLQLFPVVPHRGVKAWLCVIKLSVSSMTLFYTNRFYLLFVVPLMSDMIRQN